MTAGKLVLALNAHLPADLRIMAATTTRPEFHARFDTGGNHEAAYGPENYLVFGRETAGLPRQLLEAHPDCWMQIPMASPEARWDLHPAVKSCELCRLGALRIPAAKRVSENSLINLHNAVIRLRSSARRDCDAGPVFQGNAIASQNAPTRNEQRLGPFDAIGLPGITLPAERERTIG